MISVSMKRLCVPLFAGASLLFCLSCGNPADPAPTGLEFTLQSPVSKSVTVGEEACFEILVKNRGTSDVVVRCIKSNISLPDTLWETSFCFGMHCVTSLVDSMEFPPVAAGATDAASMHFYTFRTAGSGQVKFIMYAVDDPARKFEQTFTCTATAP